MLLKHFLGSLGRLDTWNTKGSKYFKHDNLENPIDAEVQNMTGRRRCFVEAEVQGGNLGLSRHPAALPPFTRHRDDGSTQLWRTHTKTDTLEDEVVVVNLSYNVICICYAFV